MVSEKIGRDEFIEQNLGLVHTVCKRFIGKGIEYDDLYQSGCIGLIKAYDAFDENRGVCFSTYAVPVIMGCVRRLFRDGGSIKVSRSIKELGIKIIREKMIFLQKHGEEPSISKLAEILNVTTEDITEAVCASQPTVSLSFEDNGEIKETDLPVFGVEDKITEHLLVTQALEKLSQCEQEIIKCRYFCRYTQNATAELLNMTQVQVSRAEKKILVKLRQVMND